MSAAAETFTYNKEEEIAMAQWLLTLDTVEIVDAGCPYLAGSMATQPQSLEPVVDVEGKRSGDSEEEEKPEAAECPIEMPV